MHQQLNIQFKNRKKALIFQGRTWLRKNLEDEVSIYHDRIILSFIRSEPRDLQFCMFSNEIKRIIEKNVISNVARARFLVADYCYMLRNRSFHAEKAYPLFVINKEADYKTVEEVLTELILMTMEGLLKEL